MIKPTSLKTRIMVPLLVSAACAAILVGWGSWSMGHRAAMKGMADRAASIESALKPSTFPLSPPILDLLSKLTRTDWIVVDEGKQLLSTTLAPSIVGNLESTAIVSLAPVNDPSGSRSNRNGAAVESVQFLDQRYYAFSFARQAVASGTASGNTDYLIVLFDPSEIDAAARRAAVLPLITGLSTIIFASGLVMLVATHLIKRLRHLESGVQRIAKGDFDTFLVDNGQDEIDRLSCAVNGMADQLKQLWLQVEREQGAKLLHQISGGMAHQLRNTLTGAKMAMQLHSETHPVDNGDEIQIALRQLDIAEDYVSRLLTLGKRDQRPDQPIELRRCLDDLRTTHEPIARHLGVELRWEYDSIDEHVRIKDGSALTAAVSNLVLNAMQAGKCVHVQAMLSRNQCILLVTDDGAGIDPTVSETLFEPFVSAKPEGLGLGLPLVKRLAEYLDGDVQWSRDNETTTFQLCVSTVVDDI